MDRETILKHSKAIRLEHKILPDFNDVIAEYCTIKGCSEYLSVIIQLLQQFSYYVGLGYGLWGVIEYTMDNPAGGNKVKRAITGYIGIYVLPVIFKAIRNALS